MDYPRNFPNGSGPFPGGAPPQFHNILYPMKKQSLLTNIFVNNPFQRTFASVVGSGSPSLNLRQSTSRLMNSFLEAVIKQEPAQPAPHMATSQREFNDYKKMPNWRGMECPSAQKYSKKACHNRYRPPHKKFHYSHHYPHQHDAPHHQQQQQQPHHYHQFQKHRHEKDRFSVERDIRNDRCDIFNRFASRGKPSPINNNNNNIMGAGTCPITTTTPTAESVKSPPFEIYSLEEFPAIVATTLSSMCRNGNHRAAMPQADKQQPNREQQLQHSDIDEHDFVKFQSNIALTTPTYVQPPVRFNLCEAVTKIVTSPKKLLALPLSAPKRSCLKATPLKSRNTSECSDDYIIFDYASGNNNNNSCTPCMPHEMVDDDCASDEDEEDSDDDDDDDDDIDGSSEEEEEEDEDECDRNVFDNDNLRALDDDDYVQQPDSGVEEKKVHFNAAVKVNVIRAWDYAYRAARKGDVWLQLSRDRARFNKRISDCENVLRPILAEEHRRRVFAERFETA